MGQSEASQRQSKQQVPDRLALAGGWLFRRRTLLPLPIVLLIVLIPLDAQPSSRLVVSGLLAVLAGELLRLWAVSHIGAISRTRSERLGPLVASGPFGWVRNPLYIGNLLVWVGFTISAQLLWLVPVVIAMLALEYHAIVRWEEQLLEARLGDTYRAYVEQVPRWIPAAHRRPRPAAALTISRFSLKETLFSERGTLIAIAAGYLLLWAKASAA
jgi:protein-S-isoprenylcysteine O-methyltransferase Ste14